MKLPNELLQAEEVDDAGPTQRRMTVPSRWKPGAGPGPGPGPRLVQVTPPFHETDDEGFHESRPFDTLRYGRERCGFLLNLK